MGYDIDLSKISIDNYKDIIRSTHLISSWIILKDTIHNLDIIKSKGVENLRELQQILNRKDRLLEFSKRSGIPESYLSVVRRMINGYIRKPNRLKDFPETPAYIVEKLENIGIKHTRHFFDKILTEKDRRCLSEETEIHYKEILRLTKLTDLSRIRWVNHTFAFVLYEAGYDSLEKVANSDPNQLYTTIKKMNTERKIYQAHIGLNDIKMLKESAQLLPLDITY
ncbi:DUF4332 domain-containing protein [Aquimarina sp. 2-A2]|uniref:DUF4332 domain-containing protein n=1 Tax=Aquimarina sp. 2-A2 TaxID=3382644 RepID=UPI00387F351B